MLFLFLCLVGLRCLYPLAFNPSSSTRALALNIPRETPLYSKTSNLSTHTTIVPVLPAVLEIVRPKRALEVAEVLLHLPFLPRHLFTV
jgi:hypothetical protein